MGEPLDLKQACLDLSNAAIAMFDVIEEGGNAAPLDNPTTLLNMSKAYEVIRGYYSRRTIQRMLALGVTPEQLARMDMGATDG